MSLNKVYLDFAAATPLDYRVWQAMQDASADFYNPSAIYLEARNARLKLSDIRHRVAVQLGARESEIIFTSGASEANNLAISGCLETGDEMLYSAIEHESVRLPASNWGKSVKVDGKGRLDLADLQAKITDKTKLVSVIYANNEIGTVQSLKAVAEIIKQVHSDRQKRGVNQPLLLHSDASQAPGHLDVNVARLGVDLMTLNGAKIYGPKQSGCLFVAAGVSLHPQILGGGQEQGLRAGTESLVQATGFCVALERACGRRQTDAKRLEDLRADFVTQVQKELPNAEILGHKTFHAPHIVSLRFPGVDNERLVMELDELGFMAAMGSACKASDEEPSAVLLAIGLSEVQAGEVIRFSFGDTTTKTQLKNLVTNLVTTLEKLL